MNGKRNGERERHGKWKMEVVMGKERGMERRMGKERRMGNERGIRKDGRMVMELSGYGSRESRFNRW